MKNLARNLARFDCENARNLRKKFIDAVVKAEFESEVFKAILPSSFFALLGVITVPTTDKIFKKP